jgi:putative sigma-54 modulation protein
MKFNVQSLNFSPTDQLLDLVDKKLNKLDKFKEHILYGDVYLKLDNKTKNIKDKTIEIKCSVKGNTLFVKETSKTFEETIDLAIDIMSRQVKKYKERR